MGVFWFQPPPPYVRRFWTLAPPFPKRSFPNLAHLYGTTMSKNSGDRISISLPYFEKVGIFCFSLPSPYLCRFWTLAHKILGSRSPARGLSKSVTISGPKFISFEKVGVFRFSPSSPCLCRLKADGHRSMGIRSLSLPFYVATPITLSVEELIYRLRFGVFRSIFIYMDRWCRLYRGPMQNRKKIQLLHFRSDPSQIWHTYRGR